MLVDPSVDKSRSQGQAINLNFASSPGTICSIKNRVRQPVKNDFEPAFKFNYFKNPYFRMASR